MAAAMAVFRVPKLLMSCMVSGRTNASVLKVAKALEGVTYFQQRRNNATIPKAKYVK